MDTDQKKSWNASGIEKIEWLKQDIQNQSATGRRKKLRQNAVQSALSDLKQSTALSGCTRYSQNLQLWPGNTDKPKWASSNGLANTDTGFFDDLVEITEEEKAAPERINRQQVQSINAISSTNKQINNDLDTTLQGVLALNRALEDYYRSASAKEPSTDSEIKSTAFNTADSLGISAVKQADGLYFDVGDGSYTHVVNGKPYKVTYKDSRYGAIRDEYNQSHASGVTYDMDDKGFITKYVNGAPYMVSPVDSRYERVATEFLAANIGDQTNQGIGDLAKQYPALQVNWWDNGGDDTITIGLQNTREPLITLTDEYEDGTYTSTNGIITCKLQKGGKYVIAANSPAKAKAVTAKNAGAGLKLSAAFDPLFGEDTGGLNYIPLRRAAVALGGTVRWDPESETATVRLGENTVQYSVWDEDGCFIDPETGTMYVGEESFYSDTLLTKQDRNAGVSVTVIDGTPYKDVSAAFCRAMSATAVEAEAFCNTVVNKPSVYDYTAARYSWFILQVAPGRPWNIKLKKPWEGTIKSTYPGSATAKVVLFGTVVTSEMLGNISFGYIGAALGITLPELYAGSWFVSDKSTEAQRQDEKKDRPYIQWGYNWYKER